MKLSTSRNNLYFPIAILLLVVLGFGGWQYTVLSEELKETEEKAQETKQKLESQVTNLEKNLTQFEQEYNDLLDRYNVEKNKNDEFEDRIREIEGTVGILDKLAKTDEELLQKYSKVYFLNEHYTPSELSEIDSKWRVPENREMQIHSKVEPFLENMLERAERDGIDLRIVSAFRSFDTQAQLKGAYTVTYGSGANTFSADQGYSEHQLGTTVDFTTPELGTNFTSFENTEAYEWLLDNAHRYGFILSYPPNNQYYVFEPWHWRFVGEDLARDLEKRNEDFYDLSQREIDEYLVSIFD